LSDRGAGTEEFGGKTGTGHRAESDFAGGERRTPLKHRGTEDAEETLPQIYADEGRLPKIAGSAKSAKIEKQQGRSSSRELPDAVLAR
jgi:hypothetical protein